MNINYKNQLAKQNHDQAERDFFLMHGDSLLEENEDGTISTSSGYKLTEQQVSNLRMGGYTNGGILALTDKEAEQFKDSTNLKEFFDFERRFINSDFIYSQEESSAIERDEAVQRAREEIQSKIDKEQIASDGIEYMEIVRVNYDESAGIWEVKFGREVGDAECFVVYLTQKGQTKYILYEDGI